MYGNVAHLQLTENRLYTLMARSTIFDCTAVGGVSRIV